jgi:hypothetical protein
LVSVDYAPIEASKLLTAPIVDLRNQIADLERRILNRVSADNWSVSGGQPRAYQLK